MPARADAGVDAGVRQNRVTSTGSAEVSSGKRCDTKRVWLAALDSGFGRGRRAAKAGWA